MSYRVKAAQVKNLTDARYFAAREVDTIGFHLGTEGLNWHEFKAISEWVQVPLIIVEPEWSAWDTLDWDFIDNQHYKVQIPMFLQPSELISFVGMPFVKEWILNDIHDLETLPEWLSQWDFLTKEIVLDCSKSMLSWEELSQLPLISDTIQKLSASYTIWLDAPFQPDDIDSIASKWKVYGFQLKGGEEEKVGFKSFDELDSLLDILKPLL